MRQRRFTLLLAVLSVVSGLLFAAGSVGAATFSYRMALESIASDTQFISDAKYTYQFSMDVGSSTLSYIDFEIPVEINIPVGTFSTGNAKFSVTYYPNLTATTGVQLGGEVYADGDYGTKFGVGDTRYRVLKANVPSPTSNFRIVLALKGQAFSSGRRFADLSQSDLGVVLIKAGNGANTQTFVIQTPTVVDPPVYQRPYFSSLTVFPNPVVLPDCATVSWVVSDPSAVVTIEPFVPVTGNSAEICPAAAGQQTFSITATGTGGSTTESFSVTAMDAPPPPLVFSLSVLPNPVTPPGCATIRWDAADATVTINPAGSATISDDPSDPAYATICFDENTVPGVHTFTITATVPGGSSSTVSFSITTNPQPLIETTCKQIRKNPVEGLQECVYLCLNTIDRLRQEIASATWYANGDCDPSQSPGVPLKFYAKGAPEKTLICAPCEIDVPPEHPQACPANVDQSLLPFRYYQEGLSPDVNPWKHCDVLTLTVQDQGIAAALGDDIWVWYNGSWVWKR